jgi:D-alanyl-D-alanine carboxypeptidase
VVLGSTSARERDQLAAQMLTRGFAGEFADSGKSVVNIVDDVASPPMDMKPYLCGPKAKAYVSQRLKDFPMGLRGQPSFLTDKVPPVIYAANDLGPVGGPAVAPDAIKPTDDAQPAAGDGTDGGDPPAVQPAPRSPKRLPSK